MQFKEWIWSKLNWFVTLIIATFLSAIIINIPEITLKFQILIIILILALFGLLLIYSINFYKDYKKIMLSERVPMDAILECQHKKVIFDDATFANNEAESSVFRRLYNNMLDSNEIYDRYKIIISSKEDVPNLDQITLIKDGQIQELSSLDKEITKSRRYLEIDSDELNLANPLQKTVEFFIPLHLEAGKTCDFTIRYQTKAYKNAILGKEDYIQETVNRITDKLTIEIILNGEMENKFTVNPCIEKKDGSTLSYQIFDASSERMKKTESQLKENKMLPKYKGNKGIWIINSPKVGYQYRMYFKLLPK